MPSGYRLTQQEAEKRIRNIHGDDINLSKFVFSTQRTKSLFICNVDSNHGEWLAHPKELWRTDGKKTGCPRCGKLKHKPKHSWSKTFKRLKAIHGENYSYFEETYDSVKSPMKVKCMIHDHIWEVRVVDLLIRTRMS